MTRLAVSIMVHRLEPALADAARAAEFGAEMVEYRIDRFTDDLAAVTALVERSPLPCIITCRPTWEGGHYDGDEATRIAALRAAMAATHPPAYLDLELAAWRQSPALKRLAQELADGDPTATGPGLILSAHDFERRPPTLFQQIETVAAAPEARVLKLAWFARSLRDNLEAFEILLQQYKPTIALCMGEFGQPSRVLAKKFGGLLTFASLDDSSATAPGQPTLTELKGLYRWDRLGRDTRVYGVIGYPVGHSLSPAIHNAGFDAVGHDGVYLPLSIPPEYEHFKATVGAWLDFAPLHFRGASVTIPHKEHLLRFVTERGGEIEPPAQTIGAANTLVVREDGSLFACNTDYAAALDAVCESLSLSRDDLAGRRVAVIGAGGAARAIVAGFAHHGATVVLYNRTLSKAQQIADQFNAMEALPGKVVAASLEKLSQSCCEVMINCTPIGMHPKTDASPVADGAEPACWGPGAVVFDTIYNPAETKLLRQAKAAGCVTISGIEMFVRQGAAQFELWTQKPAPREVFTRVLTAHR